MFGPGIPGRSVWCSIILAAGVHVSHADEVRQPARLGEDVQHHGRKQRDVGEMLSPRHLIQKYQATRRQRRARSPLALIDGKPVSQ
jgi:hypothetical protein